MKEKFLDFPNHSFYEYEGNVYEYYKENGYFLKTTGWKSGEDRRIYKDKINVENLVRIKPEKAKFIINEHWNSGTRTWVHNNVKYSNKDFGTLLMDMALQYNMEQGIEYKCTLVDNKHK